MCIMYNKHLHNKMIITIIQKNHLYQDLTIEILIIIQTSFSNMEIIAKELQFSIARL